MTLQRGLRVQPVRQQLREHRRHVLHDDDRNADRCREAPE